MAKSTDSGSAEEVDALKEDVRQLREDIGALLGSLKDDGSGKLQELRQRLADTSAAAGEKLRSAGDSAKQRANGMARVAEEHPFTTAVIALCSGLIAGTILGHRK